MVLFTFSVMIQNTCSLLTFRLCYRRLWRCPLLISCWRNVLEEAGRLIVEPRNKVGEVVNIVWMENCVVYGCLWRFMDVHGRNLGLFFCTLDVYDRYSVIFRSSSWVVLVCIQDFIRAAEIGESRLGSGFSPGRWA